MTASERERIARDVLSRSRADGTVVTVTASQVALMRFTREAVAQNVDESDVTVSVRAIVDGRSGVALTNAADPAALDDVVERAYGIAAIAPRESIPPELAAPATIESPPGAFAEATAHAGPDTRARIAGAIFAHAQRNGLWSSGFAMTQRDGITIANSAGALAHFDATDSGVKAKLNAPDATGFAQAYARDVTQLDGDAIGAEAARIALATREPVALMPGDYTVILMPSAVSELLNFLGGHFCAETFSDGSSFVSGKLGATVLGENVTLWDDYAHELHAATPFDSDGVPKQRVALVRDGVANGIVTDATWARRLDRANTGHAMPPEARSGPQPTAIVLAPGTASLDDLIASTPRGLLVTRLWYVRNVDQRTVLLTGMTRDGTFLIEDGAIRGGVRNMRFNQSLITALRDCVIAGTPVRTGDYHYSMVTPAVKFARFTFTSVSPY